MKDDLPEEWLPTRKTNGNDVPRSEFLASGPLRLEFMGIMDEWRSEHFDSMACWAELDGTPSPPPGACPAPAPAVSTLVGVGATLFFDQFQVDRGRGRRHELLHMAGPSLLANAAAGPPRRRHRMAVAALMFWSVARGCEQARASHEAESRREVADDVGSPKCRGAPYPSG